ncbi:hypothetical protein HDU76_006883 [Blyttiomyces sp. JEL0837]|nr:hypothetical protein HDU76_006883 [Blyttiomyces sp. JEL0837]
MANQIQLTAGKLAEFKNGRSVWRHGTTEQLLNDAARFIWRFEESISENPLQIYSVGVAFTPQSTKLYQTYGSLYASKSVKILPPELEWSSLLKYFIGHKTGVSRLSFIKNGNWLVSSSENDQTVRVWDFKTGKEIMKIDQQVLHCVSNNDKLMATLGGGRILIWDLVKVKVIHTVTHAYGRMTFTPDSRHLAISCSADLSVAVIDVTSGLIVKRLQGYVRTTITKDDMILRDFCFSPDGARIFLALGGNVEIWDCDTGYGMQTLFGHQSHVESVQVSKDGKMIVSGSDDNTVRVWDSETGGNLWQLSGHTLRITAVAISDDGTKILSASFDKSLILWDIKTGRKLQQLPGQSHMKCCAISPDGKTAVSAGSHDGGGIALWDLAGEYKSELSGERRIQVSNVTTSPDGKKVACRLADLFTISIWDLESEKVLGVLDQQQIWVPALEWSNDGSKVITGDREGNVKVWDVVEKFCEETTKLAGHKNSLVISVCLAANGLLAASSTRQQTIIWNLRDGTALTTIPQTRIPLLLSFSSDSQFLAFSSPGHVISLWDISSSSVSKSLKGHTTTLYTISFSSDGLLAASTDMGGCIMIWDLARETELHKIKGHTDGLRSIYFSSDNQRVMAFKEGIRCKVAEWDVNTGNEIRSMKGAVFNYLSAKFRLSGAHYAENSSKIVALFIIGDRFAACSE